MSDNHDDERPNLERAIHHLREAETLHNSDEYNGVREDVSLEFVGDAIDAISDHLDGERERREELGVLDE